MYTSDHSYVSAMSFINLVRVIVEFSSFLLSELGLFRRDCSSGRFSQSSFGHVVFRGNKTITKPSQATVAPK